MKNSFISKSIYPTIGSMPKLPGGGGPSLPFDLEYEFIYGSIAGPFPGQVSINTTWKAELSVKINAEDLSEGDQIKVTMSPNADKASFASVSEIYATFIATGTNQLFNFLDTPDFHSESIDGSVPYEYFYTVPAGNVQTIMFHYSSTQGSGIVTNVERIA